MNEALTSQILAISEPKQFARLLAIVIHQLTVYARASYRSAVLPGEAGFVRLQITNELIHELSAKLRAQIDGTAPDQQYPNDVFVQVLIETAKDGCASDLEQAFRFALERLGSQPVH